MSIPNALGQDLNRCYRLIALFSVRLIRFAIFPDVIHFPMAGDSEGCVIEEGVYFPVRE